MTHDKDPPWYVYTLIRDEYPPTDDLPERRVGYGIAVCLRSTVPAQTAPEDTPSAWVRDISPDREAVAALVRLCNEGHLSPLHLADVIEDFLGA